MLLAGITILGISGKRRKKGKKEKRGKKREEEEEKEWSGGEVYIYNYLQMLIFTM